MKVLFATTNPAKIKRYASKLQEKGIEIISIGLDNNLFIEELPEEKQPGTHVRRVGGKESKQYTWGKDHFYFVDKPCEIRNPGYPLDSISIIPEYNKYFVELTPEEKNSNSNNEGDVIDFIVKSLA